MNPADLLSGAAYLAGRASDSRPKQADLRRAISSIYYALFHTLARCCADSMIGSENSVRRSPAYRHVYRALDHGFAKAQCSNANVIKQFPKEINDFSTWFVEMQTKRHRADYDPFHRSAKWEVTSDINVVSGAIDRLLSASAKDRRAFAAFVLLRSRN